MQTAEQTTLAGTESCKEQDANNLAMYRSKCAVCDTGCTALLQTERAVPDEAGSLSIIWKASQSF